MAWDEWEQLKSQAAERQSTQMQLNQLDPGDGSPGIAGKPSKYGDLKVPNASLTKISKSAHTLYNELWDKARVAVPSTDSAAGDLSKQGFALGAATEIAESGRPVGDADRPRGTGRPALRRSPRPPAPGLRPAGRHRPGAHHRRSRGGDAGAVRRRHRPGVRRDRARPGFAVHPIAATSGLEVTENGRIVVDRTMRSVSHPDVYAAGDSAHAIGDNGRPLPMSCASAGYAGRQAVEAIMGRLTGREITWSSADQQVKRLGELYHQHLTGVPVTVVLDDASDPEQVRTLVPERSTAWCW
ncbi:hypothetical protein SGLAM104S_10621 [Streptomyces glaucescens]